MPNVWNVRDRSYPANALYIGRAMPGRLGSKYANPYKITEDCPRELVLKWYYLYAKEKLATGEWTISQIKEDTKNGVVCWCAPEPCHGNVLLDLVEVAEKAQADND